MLHISYNPLVCLFTRGINLQLGKRYQFQNTEYGLIKKMHCTS